jgi:hypothetical protein
MRPALTSLWCTAGAGSDPVPMGVLLGVVIPIVVLLILAAAFLVWRRFFSKKRMPLLDETKKIEL